MATQHSTPDRHVGLQHIAFNPAQLQDFAEPDSPPACSVTSGPCDAYEYAAEQMEPLPAATLTAAPVVSALMRDEVAVYRQGMQENEIAVLELRREVLGLRAELALSERLRIALYCAGKGKLLMAKTALSGVERDLNRLRRMRAEDHKALVAARKQARDATEARQCLENERLLHEEQRRNHEEQCAALQQRLSEQQTTRAAEREAHAHQLAVEKGAVGREVQMLRQDMEARLRDERMLADERLAVARRHHEQQCSHFQEQLHHAQGKLIEQQQAFQDQLSEMHAKHKNEIESWQDQVDAAHARFAAQARAMQDLDSDAKARQHELESDMAHLQRELAADLASMQRDNEALLEELDRARTQHAQEAEIWKAAFQAQCAKLDGEHAEESGALIEKLSAQETEVEELRGVVKALNSEIHALQRQAGERAVQAGNLTQQLNRLSLHHDAVGMRFASAHCWQHFTQPQMTAVFRVWAARAAASRRLAQFCRLRQWRVLRRWARWSRGRRAGHELLQRRNTALSERVFVSWHHVAHAWQAWRKRQQWLMGCCLRGWASLIVHHPKRNARGMTLRIDVNPVDSSQDALHVPLHRVISLPTTPKSPAHPLRSSLSNANQWTPSPNHMPGSRGLAGQLHSVLSSPSMAGELSASTGDGEPLLTARSDMSAIGRMPSSASAMGGDDDVDLRRPSYTPSVAASEHKDAATSPRQALGLLQNMHSLAQPQKAASPTAAAAQPNAGDQLRTSNVEQHQNRQLVRLPSYAPSELHHQIASPAAATDLKPMRVLSRLPSYAPTEVPTREERLASPTMHPDLKRQLSRLPSYAPSQAATREEHSASPSVSPRRQLIRLPSYAPTEAPAPDSCSPRSPGSRSVGSSPRRIFRIPSYAPSLGPSNLEADERHADASSVLTSQRSLTRLPSYAPSLAASHRGQDADAAEGVWEAGHQLRSQPAIQPRSHEKVWEQVQASRRLDRLPTYAPSEAIDQRSPQQQQPAGGSGAGGGPRLASAPSYAPTITPSSLRSSLASTASSSSFSDLPPPDVAWHKHRHTNKLATHHKDHRMLRQPHRHHAEAHVDRYASRHRAHQGRQKQHAGHERADRAPQPQESNDDCSSSAGSVASPLAEEQAYGNLPASHAHARDTHASAAGSKAGAVAHRAAAQRDVNASSATPGPAPASLVDDIAQQLARNLQAVPIGPDLHYTHKELDMPHAHIDPPGLRKTGSSHCCANGDGTQTARLNTTQAKSKSAAVETHQTPHMRPSRAHNSLASGKKDAKASRRSATGKASSSLPSTPVKARVASSTKAGTPSKAASCSARKAPWAPSESDRASTDNEARSMPGHAHTAGEQARRRPKLVARASKESLRSATLSALGSRPLVLPPEPAHISRTKPSKSRSTPAKATDDGAAEASRTGQPARHCDEPALAADTASAADDLQEEASGSVASSMPGSGGGASAPGYEACLEPPSRMDSGIDPWAAVQDRLQAPVDPCMCQQESSLAQLLAGEAADLIRKTEPGRAQESAALADRSNQSGRTHDLTQQAASTCSTSQSSLLDIFASGGPETPRRHPSVGRAQHWPAQDQHADQTDTSYHSKQSSMMDFVGASAGQFGSGCGGRGHEREPAAKRRASRSSGAKVKVKRIPVIHACPS